MSKYKNNFLKWLFMLGTGGLAGFFDADDTDSTDKSTWRELFDKVKASNLGRKITGSGLTDAELQANEFNAQQAQIQRDFEERMANTAFQRQVADMKRSGVNPALAMSPGASGATVPSGSAASSVSPGSVGLPFSLSELIQIVTLPLQMKKMKADIKQTNVQTAGEELKNQYQSMVNGYYPQMTELTMNKIVSDIAGTQADIDLKSVQKRIGEFDAILREAEANKAETLVQARLDLMDAQTKEAKDAAAAHAARAAMDSIESTYMKNNNMKMGSNSLIALATAINGWLQNSDDGDVADIVVNEVKSWAEEHGFTNEDGSFIKFSDIRDDRAAQRSELAEKFKKGFGKVRQNRVYQKGRGYIKTARVLTGH